MDDRAPVTDIRAMQARVAEMNKLNGWYETDRTIPEGLMLIVTEVAEAVEDYRTGDMETYLDVKGKPCGYPSELADVLARLLDQCERDGIDLAAEFQLKMDFNMTRGHRHGGKKL